MSNQFQVYRSYLPTREQIQPFAIAALITIGVFGFGNVVFGKDASTSVVDQTITSVTEQSSTNEETKSEESNTNEGTPSATVAEAVNNQVEKQEAEKEAAQKAEAQKKKQQAKEEAEQEAVAANLTTNQESMPTTGPVENALVTVAIVAVGYAFRDFIRSKAELARSPIKLKKTTFLL